MRWLAGVSLALALAACSFWTGVTYRASVQCVGIGQEWVCDCIPMAPPDMQADPATWTYVWDAGDAWIRAFGERALIRWPGPQADEFVTVRCIVYMDPARRAIGSADVWVPRGGA
jgi:hypothetical protein